MTGPTPPSVGDILWCARGYGFPALTLAGISIPAGEDTWRATLATLTGEERLAVWGSDAWPRS